MKVSDYFYPRMEIFQSNITQSKERAVQGRKGGSRALGGILKLNPAQTF